MTSEKTQTVETAYKEAAAARTNALKSRVEFFESTLPDGAVLEFERVLPMSKTLGPITYWVISDKQGRNVTLSKISDLEKVIGLIKEEKPFKLKAHLLGEELRFSDRTKRSYYRRIFEYSLVE